MQDERLPSNLKAKSRKTRTQYPKDAFEDITPSSDEHTSGSTAPNSPTSVTGCGLHGDFKISDILGSDGLLDTNDGQEDAATKAVQLTDLLGAMRGCAVKLIEWAQRIPAFAHLSFEDQIRLLKASWCELYVLHLAAHNRPNCDTLVLGGGVTCKRDQIGDPEVGHLVNRISDEVSGCFESLSTEPVELACLKGILFFNPGMLLVGHLYCHVDIILFHSWSSAQL